VLVVEGEQPVRGARVDRERVLEVAHAEAAGPLARRREVHAQVAVVERGGELAAEHGEHELALAAPRERLPVDVEPPRVRRLLAEREHVVPVRVLGAGAHVVGHHVEQHAEARGACGVGQPVERGVAAERRVGARRVDHVVPVGAAGARVQHRRQVQVRGAEAGDVRDELARAVEVEVRAELEAVGRGERRAREGP
jgi:hypothetical protein